jgi:hypothetical protein
MAAGLLQATTLTFPVVVAEIGSDLHLLSPATAAALTGVSAAAPGRSDFTGRSDFRRARARGS